jgi:prepilin-type N-terminal cleavage/methylation domain-containing protein
VSARRTCTGARGYTIVELMMAITVLAIGVTGIFSMQKITIVANYHAKNLAVATHVAQAWADRLAVDATMWNHPSKDQSTSDIGNTRWLSNVNGAAGTWFRPDYESTLEFGPSFDALGNVLADPAQSVYCTHVKLNWLRSETGVMGNGLVRAEIRVFWLKDDMGGGVNSDPVCDPDTDPDLVGAAVDKYHFVYQTTAIRQNNEGTVKP